MEWRFVMRYRRLLVICTIVLSLVFAACKTKQTDRNYTSSLEGEAILVPSMTGGIVNKLFISEGDWVDAGDTLAVLDSREIKYQIEQLDASQRELEIQKIIAKTNMNQTQEDLRHSMETTERLQSIYDVNGLSRQSLDDANNMAKKVKSMAANSREQYMMLEASQSKVESQKKILRKKLNDAILIAPSAGTITGLYFHAGEAIPMFGNLCEVVDTRVLTTKIYVAETVLNAIRIGQPVMLSTANGSKHPGKVVVISSKAEFTPKTILTPDTRSAMVYAIKISVDNPKAMLKIGMPVDIEL